MIRIIVDCDRCPTTERGTHWRAADARTYLAQLRSQGWLMTSHETLCPACLEDRELLGKLEEAR